MASLVALDLETTGTDPARDAIIEIGVVRFNGPRVEETWSTLVNPGRPIPPAITQLTGINDLMVRDAPPLHAVLPRLERFVGDAVVVGHNIGFDLGFLRRQGALTLVEAVDTYELAAILMPAASRYNLGSLGQLLGIPLPNSHRALDDARLTHAVYHRLYEKALTLPVDIVQELVRLSEALDWMGYWFFSEVLQQRAREGIRASAAPNAGRGWFQSLDAEWLARPLEPRDVPVALDIDEVAALLEPGGVFSRYMPGFEHRSEQVAMLRAVAQALSEGYHLLVEAGTGTGKSFAYLIPAALWAWQNGRRVVISTNTITLQEQLIKKDIPDLVKALGLDLRATVMKGRINYLCPRRLEALRQRGPQSVDELRVLGKILVWLWEGGSGDRSEITLHGAAEREVWQRLSAEDEECKAETCLKRTGGACPFYRSRQAALTSHLVVVNHALLLADVVAGNRVIPEYEALIVDEAHHLEEATTNALSYRVTREDLARMLRELGGTSSGILGHVLTQLRNVLRPSDFAAANREIQHLTDLAFQVEQGLGQFFSALDVFLEYEREGQPLGMYGQQVRLLPGNRHQPTWEAAELAWQAVHERLIALITRGEQFVQALGEVLGLAPEELDDVLGSLNGVLRRLGEADHYITALVSQPDPDFVYWVETSGGANRIALQVAPVHIGSLMEKYLWNEKRSIVLTSATLTTQGNFDYLRNRLNAYTADELALDSPFDYQNSTLLYIVNDIPEPNGGGDYQRKVEQVLVQLAKATGGRMLVLFTSYAQLRRTSEAITARLLEADIQVYEQGEGVSSNLLLESFRESERAVLLGTRAFWEGVDIPGEALSVLVIVRLPFDVPSDPIVAARAETFEDPFNEYHLPEAILRFRQGFGRLIRTQTDRGVVVILDRRVLTKSYGKAFLESLPQCTLRVASMQELPAAAARWLNL
ncbi:helicase C-terminal domain-containing protein [Thermanaerothrix sp.]|jgi:DNA polymerase-3 subunit epsilon/ATP-dependent DNA helicase DinG|uniref:helicase C-terminal domain-containing protein n=1 Tax=Thermanaerothrix sp. TaxID=2972675 RepID=UPI002ADE81D5|nr:helicase C-terminal domain-containing protein [Thermanaerothrix sp.]